MMKLTLLIIGITSFLMVFSEKTPDEISEARKDELEKSVKESIAFIDKTINKDLIMMSQRQLIQVQ